MKKYFNSIDQIKVGVIGYGGAFNMGKWHLDWMQKSGMTPYCVAEISEERLAEARKDFPGIQTYSSVEAMLTESDVNLVVIITPHNTHAELAEQCIRSGRHVVCEKPLAITVEEVDRLIAAAEEYDVMLSTYHNRHWNGCIIEAVRRIKEEGAIGDIVRIDAAMLSYGQPKDWWRSSKSISGGILYDFGVHVIEYAMQLIDSELTEVVGYKHEGFWSPHTAWKEDTIEDAAYAVARFKSGQWLTLHFSKMDARGEDEPFVITGTKGSYAIKGFSEAAAYKIYTHDGEQQVVEEGKSQANEFIHYYDNIAQHLTGNTELIINATWSRKPIEIIDLAVQSAQEGRAISVNSNL